MGDGNGKNGKKKIGETDTGNKGKQGKEGRGEWKQPREKGNGISKANMGKEKP